MLIEGIIWWFNGMLRVCEPLNPHVDVVPSFLECVDQTLPQLVFWDSLMVSHSRRDDLMEWFGSVWFFKTSNYIDTPAHRCKDMDMGLFTTEIHMPHRQKIENGPKKHRTCFMDMLRLCPEESTATVLDISCSAHHVGSLSHFGEPAEFWGKKRCFSLVNQGFMGKANQQVANQSIKWG